MKKFHHLTIMIYVNALIGWKIIKNRYKKKIKCQFLSDRMTILIKQIEN